MGVIIRGRELGNEGNPLGVMSKRNATQPQPGGERGSWCLRPARGRSAGIRMFGLGKRTTLKMERTRGGQVVYWSPEEAWR